MLKVAGMASYKVSGKIQKEEDAMNDKNIVQLFFERSEQAITELSQKYGKLCFHIALNILKCNEDAEECENDTYLKTWNNIPPDEPMCLSAYVSRIVRNLALSKYRYNHRQMRDSHLQVYLSELQDCIPASQDVEASADDTVNNAIRTFLSTQDLTARALFIQRYFYMESISVLSKKFGLKESNVSTKLNRTRLKLKQYLEREGLCYETGRKIVRADRKYPGRYAGGCFECEKDTQN